MTHYFKAFICAGLVCLLLQTNSEAAGLGDMLDAIEARKVTYHVSVVDDQENPVPDATVWEVISYRRKPFDPAALMERLTLRYGADIDIVTTVKLHPSLMVYQTDRQGKIELTMEAKAREDKDAGTLAISLAALKRGFQPIFVSGQVKLDSTRDVTLKLHALPQSYIDPSLQQLDEIRSAIETGKRMGQQSPGYAQLLADSARKVRQLAEEAKAGGQNDTAALLFHYLAFIPSVDRTVDQSGRQTGIRIMNGYDEKDPRRKTDYEQCLALNGTNPQLLYERMQLTYRNPAAPHALVMGDMQRKAFLADAKSLRQRFGDRLWPFDFQLEWQELAKDGVYAQSCAHLNVFYRFEPTYFTQAEWAGNKNYISLEAKEHGETYQCEFD